MAVLAPVFLAQTAFASPPKLTEAQRIAIIRLLVAQVGIARTPLPPDKHGIVISPQGQILNLDSVRSSLQDTGDSSKTGDRLAITAITFKSDSIVFAINGGPHKSHWYNHVSLGMGTNAQPVAQSVATGPHGALITLKFPHALPSLTPQQVQADLGYLIDWSPPSRAEVMVHPLPPSVRAAIKTHRVLVGMTPAMVVAALGRTGNKIREADDQGQMHEDWIYGTPPAQTTFVRFIGDRVTRVTTYLPNGSQIVDSTPDPALAVNMKQQQQEQAERAAEATAPRPTLRRPGDAPPPSGQPGQAIPQGSTQPDVVVPSMPTGFPGQASPPGMPPTQGQPPAQGPPVCCRPFAYALEPGSGSIAGGPCSSVQYRPAAPLEFRDNSWQVPAAR